VTILVEREGINKRRKQVKRTRKGKRKKSKKAKYEEMNAQGGKTAEKWVPRPHMGLLTDKTDNLQIHTSTTQLTVMNQPV